jgi:FkbM family methyltransferase
VVKTQIVDTPFGKICVYQKDDCISATIKGGVFWDGPLLLPFYEKYAKKDGVAIDIGSFCGNSAVVLAKTCKHVVAVEPLHWELCEATFAANRLKNVTLLRGAAYDEACWLLPAPDREQGQTVEGVSPDAIDNPGGVALMRATTVEAREVECVQAFVLDKWIDEEEKVCLIKSDAQGCDLRALRGLRKTIEKWRPAVLFEYEAHLAEMHGDTWGAHQRFFEELGYVLEEQDKIGYAHNFVAVSK